MIGEAAWDFKDCGDIHEFEVDGKNDSSRMTVAKVL